MNRRPLTDAQISTALRARLPEVAAPGLRERVREARETTAQVRSIPSFLGALNDADPIGRRRSLLLAAALLLALAAASAAAVGAMRLLERDPVQELSQEPPADIAAFVLSSHEQLTQLPPVAFTWHDSEAGNGRVYVDRSGAVRFDELASPEATEPLSYRVLSPDHTISGVAPVDSRAVWVEPGREAIGDDPRTFIRGLLTVDAAGRGCELDRDASDAADGPPATGWRYVAFDHVAGRPAHHVACAGASGLDVDLWLDIETRLILRVRQPLVGEDGDPVPGQFATREVTEIDFGEQPAALFGPPDGMDRISEAAYAAYICPRDLPNVLMPGISDCPTPPEAEATPPPEPAPTPEPTPTPTMPPTTNACTVSATTSSEPAGPFAWSEASLKEDWPVPVRPEPGGTGSVQPMPLTYLDPTGDTGRDAFPCIDIRAVVADTSEVHVKLAGDMPPLVDVTERRVAYGLVIDDDRDGVPDWRYGIDTTPAEPTMDGGTTYRRWWRTNLHTGQTEAGPVDVSGSGDWLAAPFKARPVPGPGVRFLLGGELDTTNGPASWGRRLDVPFYTFASVIENGRVVATDYAPDTGWLVAIPGARPGGTYELEGGESTFRLPLTMTLPDGWFGGNEIWGSDTGFAMERAFRVGREIGRRSPMWSGVQLVILDDPGCLKPYGPGVDDVARYLEDQPKKLRTPGQSVSGPRWANVAIDISENHDVVLDGYRGMYLEYDVDLRSGVAPDAACGWPMWGDHHSETWILDVDGIRLVIDASSTPGAPEAARAELRRAVESIHFQR